jgi:hypothetical protein
MFDAKKSEVRQVQLKVQQLALRFKLVGNATPASVVLTIDDPSVLFLETESTSAVGATDLSAKVLSGETYTQIAPVDANGIYSGLVHVGEKIKKVLSVQLMDAVSGAVQVTQKETAPTSQIISIAAAGDYDAISFSIDEATANTSGTKERILLVRYAVEN